MQIAKQIKDLRFCGTFQLFTVVKLTFKIQVLFKNRCKAPYTTTMVY